jgi:predicted membrane protein
MNNTIVSTFPISIFPIRLKKTAFFFRAFWAIMFLITAVLIAVCVFQLNAQAQETYLIKQYENKLDQLTQENKVLEINFSRTNSLSNIGTLAQNQVFEKTGKIEYIRVLETTALAK